MAEEVTPKKESSEPPNCFTVMEKELVGISLYENEEEGGYCLSTGETEGKIRIPLSRTWRDQLDMYLSEAGEKPKLPRIRRASIPKELWPNAWLDGERKLIQSQKGDMHAIVHVCTSCGEGGSLAYTATSYKEVLENGVINRKYEEIFPPPGVDVLALGYGQSRTPQMLLRMAPRSSFRIVRTYHGLGDAPPVINVRWNGEPKRDFKTGKIRDHALEVWSPGRFNKAA